MKRIFTTLFAIMFIFMLTACQKKDNYNESSENNNKTAEKETNQVADNTQEEDDVYVDDDEINEYDDEDNRPLEEGTIVVEKVINCDGCVYAYFSDEGDKAKTLGSTLSPSEYTTDINNLKTGGGKQRHNFFGLVLDGNKISKAYACILKDNKIYCIQGSTDGAYFTSNIGVLNQIFTADQCRYISNGNTYVCTDGNYNGDTITTGFTSLHYETSCTIYGKDSNTGKLICH